MSTTKILIEAEITDPKRPNAPVYRTGAAKGLPCWEIAIRRTEAQKLPWWKQAGHVLIISIRLSIGQSEYDATLRLYPYAPDNSWTKSYICAPLNGGKVKLVTPLNRAGFKEGPVKLKVVGNKIWVV